MLNERLRSLFRLPLPDRHAWIAVRRLRGRLGPALRDLGLMQRGQAAATKVCTVAVVALTITSLGALLLPQATRLYAQAATIWLAVPAIGVCWIAQVWASLPMSARVVRPLGSVSIVLLVALHAVPLVNIMWMHCVRDRICMLLDADCTRLGIPPDGWLRVIAHLTSILTLMLVVEVVRHPGGVQGAVFGFVVGTTNLAFMLLYDHFHGIFLKKQISWRRLHG